MDYSKFVPSIQIVLQRRSRRGQIASSIDYMNCQTLGYTRDVPKATAGGKSMFHLIWYVLIGLISGVIAKSVMHVHIAIFWTIVLGIIGSIIGGGVSHMFSRPTNERYHPAGLILSTLGAMLVLFICYKLKIHFPQV
jgi:uncharacterized membrane protein YeaQ/YmgE (transglycosylase-associated protein family)